MQIIDKGKGVSIKLLIHEGRLLRDAAYLARRAGINLGNEHGQRLEAAAEALLELVEDSIPDQTKLDRQDAEDVPAPELIDPREVL
jgi:hypothetical protein